MARPSNEQVQARQKREKFVKLAERRTGKALEGIRLLEPLTNPDVYESQPEDWQAIRAAIDSELAKLDEAIRTGKKPVTNGFKLTTGA